MISFRISIACVVFIVGVVGFVASNSQSHNNSSDELAEGWHRLLSSAFNWTRSSPELKLIASLANHPNLSRKCANSLTSLHQAINRFDDWSLAMINSWGRVPRSGLLSGTFTDLGAYDQCLAIESPSNQPQLSGRYCLVDFSPKLPKLTLKQTMFNSLAKQPFLQPRANSSLSRSSGAAFLSQNFLHAFYFIKYRVGVCVPAGCEEDDIRLVVKSVVKTWGMETNRVKCEMKQHQSLSWIQIVAVLTGLSFLGCVIIATLLDTSDTRSAFINSFSAIHNLKTLLRVKKVQRQTDLGCVHGIRTITLWWIIMGHTMLWANFQVYNRSFAIKDMLTSFAWQPILNGTYSVETFFVVSGVLTSFITWEVTKGHRKNFSVLSYIFVRYFRLTPQMAIFILMTFLLPLTNNGPLWNEVVGNVIDNCANYWWSNLLYIQNYYNVDKMCALHTWWVCVEYQLHLISVITILAMFRKEVFGHVTNVLVAGFFALVAGWIIYANNFPPGLINTQRHILFEKINELLFWKPYLHAPPFLAGLAVGHLLKTKRVYNLSTSRLFLFWSLSTLGMLLVTYDFYPWVFGQPYNRLTAALIFVGCRSVWGLSVAWLIWACVTGNGGIVNRILSAKVLVPLSRLSYSAYLTHAWSVWSFMGTARYGVDTSVYSITFIFFSHLLWAYLLGSVFYLLFEAPIMSLQRHLFTSIGLIPKKSTSTPEANRLKPRDTNNNSNGNATNSQATVSML